ncbi:hypothetical protein ACJMK2_036454 [Sinanodonta woodiana]|uniref:Sjoegren syndrome/scleroderma autoantigen 1 n=1 Tax=Sinanodonta woodiana TaxID=1069815 RepID=A0ABD3WKR4_SINWO
MAAHTKEGNHMFIDDDDYEWQPPSEAEMKIIEARRERSNKISKLMGDYLLKGYKMLGSTCSICDTILLQDKQGQNYCVACKELDADANKDDPVMNEQAAVIQMREGTKSREAFTPSEITDHLAGVVTEKAQSTSSFQMEPQGRVLKEEPQPGSSQAKVITFGHGTDSFIGDVRFRLEDSIDILCQKIGWATEELKKTTSVDHSISLCHLIKSCADALQSLKSLKP